jgi:hypothetical protein
MPKGGGFYGLSPMLCDPTAIRRFLSWVRWQNKVKVQTVPYISTAHCIALRSNADESRKLYGTFGKFLNKLKLQWLFYV